MKDFLRFLFETIKMAALAFLIVFPIRYFLFQPFVVSGDSMCPSFEDGDYLLIDELSFRIRQPERGEVIVFHAPINPSARYIKRIIGLPNETIEIKEGRVIIFNEEGATWILDESVYLSDSLQTNGDFKITLGQEEYFMMGDNRRFSSDSRTWGALPKKNIVGRTMLRAWPFNNLALIKAPQYELLDMGEPVSAE